MGLLDDAIREHLELKKRHGASEAEVSELESEVFGPSRLPTGRPAAPAPQAEGPSVPDTDEDPAMPTPPEPDPEPAVAPESEPPPLPPTPPAAAEAAPEPEPIAAPEPTAAPEPEAETQVHAPPATKPEPEPWLDDADEVPAAESLEHSEAEQPAEDVLEETPDFLQETPDHDRLWFEQKPPRDFDFDR